MNKFNFYSFLILSMTPFISAEVQIVNTINPNRYYGNFFIFESILLFIYFSIWLSIPYKFDIDNLKGKDYV